MEPSNTPRYFRDLYVDLLNRVREKSGVSATDDLAKRLINVALQDMHIGFAEKFPWAERNAMLVTQPQYTTGTVSISKGSTSLTGVSTLWNTANDFSVNNMRAGGKIVVGGSVQVYEINAVGSDTGATLSSMFVGEDQSTQTYTYFEDEYALASDFMRPIDQRQFSDGIPIELIGRTEFRKRYVRNNIPGRPFVATIIDRGPSTSTSTTRRRLLLHRPPEKAYSIPYSFITANLVVSGSATGSITVTSEPVAGNTVTLNGQVWGFKSGPSGGSMTGLGSNTTATLDNLVTDLNASTLTDLRIATYKRVENRLEIDYDTAGVEGEGYTLNGGTLGQVSATTLSLGTAKTDFTGDLDEPLVPLRYRHAIVFHALYHYYRDRKDDTRSQEARAEYTDIMLRIAGDTEIGQSRPQLRPRISAYVHRAKRPWSGGRGKYDYAGKFDRFEI